MCGPLRYLGLWTSSHCSGPSAGHGWGVKEAAAARRGRAEGRGRGAGAGYSASPSGAVGRPHTGCTAASRPPRREGWCWSISEHGTAWRRHRKAGHRGSHHPSVQAPPVAAPPARPLPAPPVPLPPAPGAVSAVDDGVVGGVHRPEVVLGLFHDAAALARLGAALGLRGICEGPERLSPTPTPWNLSGFCCSQPKSRPPFGVGLWVDRGGVLTRGLQSPTYLPGTSCGR